MKIINTDAIDPQSLKAHERDWVYNGLDCCVTLEVLDVLLPQLDPHTAATYQFSRDLQGPCLEMSLRGVRVDGYRKSKVIEAFLDQLEVLEERLERIVNEGVGMPYFNWRSYPDLQDLFYRRLGLPAVRKKGRVTVDRGALEKLQGYVVAAPIIKHMTAMRDLHMKISKLKSGVDRDGRIRASYNIAGTSTGRLSSSFNQFGSGTNLQNVEESLRTIFIADEGMKLAKFDAKQGESFCVGAIEWNLFGDPTYLNACESGDLHTYVSRLCEPKLGWTGNLREDRAIAERPYYRHHSLRKLCKSIGHGTNYRGGPKTLSALYKIDIPAIAKFQGMYFKTFPAHQRWHANVAQRLRDDGYIISLSGRKRWFFGRRTEDDTIREAIAFDPQCTLTDVVNRAMLRIWERGIARIYMQDHDALTYQYPEELEDEIIPKIFALLKEEIPLKNGRTLEIGYDCRVGWNKGEFSKENPEGLKEYNGHDRRERTPTISILDRP
jgi:DNA polymerase-1